MALAFWDGGPPRWESCPALAILPQAHQKPPMTPNELIDALRDDIEWPAATLRLQFNHLAPLEEACADDPVMLGRWWNCAAGWSGLGRR